MLLLFSVACAQAAGAQDAAAAQVSILLLRLAPGNKAALEYWDDPGLGRIISVHNTTKRDSLFRITIRHKQPVHLRRISDGWSYLLLPGDSLLVSLERQQTNLVYGAPALDSLVRILTNTSGTDAAPEAFVDRMRSNMVQGLELVRAWRRNQLIAEERVRSLQRFARLQTLYSIAAQSHVYPTLASYADAFLHDRTTWEGINSYMTSGLARFILETRAGGTDRDRLHIELMKLSDGDRNAGPFLAYLRQQPDSLAPAAPGPPKRKP